jgi:hypothetical protein
MTLFSVAYLITTFRTGRRDQDISFDFQEGETRHRRRVRQRQERYSP